MRLCLNKDVNEEIQDYNMEFDNSIKIQKSSSSLLLMNVEDILGYAQIKANKFNKIIK